MTQFLSVLLCLVFAALCPRPVSAEVVLSVSGTPGAGITVWRFSGEDRLSFTENFTQLSSADLSGFADFTESGSGLLGMSNVTITNVSQRAFAAINLLAVQNQFPIRSTDNIQIRLDGPLPIASGDLIQFSGATELPIDLNSISEGGLPYSDPGGFFVVGLDARLEILEAAAVPEPASVLAYAMALGLCFGACQLRGRRMGCGIGAANPV